MKKAVFLIPLLLLAWCWTQVEQATPTQPWTKTIQTKSDEVVLYYWEPAVFASYDFTVIDSYETDSIKSNNQFESDLVSWEHSKYVVANVKYLNTYSEEFEWWWEWYRTLTDSQWRNYKNIACTFYSDKCDNREIRYKPWIPTESQIIFEVAGDSEWYYILDQNSKTWTKYKIVFSEKTE